mmetsp:Transcript_148003/g.368882  ORF Transcript_148003/g.368882 Transcript_148003/m.368882 type:complete len:216 (+) Transcript_148003:132-779(+)
MKAIAAMETPNIFWCSFVSWSSTLVLDWVSLSKCLSMLSGECADLCTSAMSACKLSSLECLSSVASDATEDKEVSSFLIASNSAPSLWPVFLSSSAFNSAKLPSMTSMRLPRDSIARDICCLIGCVSTTSLKTMLVNSLMASDSARWSLKVEASARTSIFSSAGTGGGGAWVVCASSPFVERSLLTVVNDKSSKKPAFSSASGAAFTPPKLVKPM